MGFRPSGDSIAPLGSFIHRQTSTTPSEHTTSVNGHSRAQSFAFSTASHSAIVPSKRTEVREVQFEKAHPSMLVTLSGMVTEVREVQYEKAQMPMLVTLSGIVTEVSAVGSRRLTKPFAE